MAETNNAAVETAPEVKAPKVKAPKVKEPKAPKPEKAAKPAKEPKPQKQKGLRIPYEKRKSLYAYGFLAIWLIGSLYFFVRPLLVSLWYSFNETAVKLGYMETKFIGIQNYIKAFRENTEYTEALLAVLSNTLWKTPLIIVFSIFIAVILNQKFRGRTFARAVFFLPVIIATGPVLSIINGDMDTSGYSGGADQFSTMFETDMTGALFNFLGVYNISDKVTDMISTVTSNVFNPVWNSGIQIIIFLSALQNIPFSAKEAASIEGATAWEFFWKITIPYISPMIVTNLIYTIVDSFIDPNNSVMSLVLARASAWYHGESAAMAWAYFLIVIIALCIVLPIINKFVYYEV